MKRIYLYMLQLVCIGTLMVSSCTKEEWGVGNVKRPDGSGSGEWNKNKTIEVYYITELNDGGVSDYDAVSNFFLKKGSMCTLGIIDRSDVNYAIRSYGPTDVAFKSAHFLSFALNRFSGTTMEGSTILFNHKINSESSFKVTNDCFVKFIPVQTKTTTASPVDIFVPFSTVRLDSKEQIMASESVFKTLSSTSYEALIIGTVKTELLPELKTVADKVSGYAFTEVVKNPDADYAIFMLGLKSWVLRETTMNSVSGNLNAYCLFVEASVEP